MIALAVALAVAATPKVVEVVDTSSSRIAVQIVVKLPELDARELGMARVLEAVLPDGTSELTKAKLMLLTGQSGSPISCRLMPDCLRVQYSLPIGSLDTAGVIAESVCLKASLSAESLESALASLPYRYRGYWSEALDGRQASYDRIKLNDLKGFYTHLFRPENMTIGVAGNFAIGDAEKQFASAFKNWTPDKDAYPRYHFTDLPKAQETRRRAIATIELYSEVMPADLGKNTMMASILGLGKGCIAFQVIREKLAYSYRQEAFLWPSESGVQLRMIAAVTDIARAKDAAETIRQEALKAVGALNEADLERARNLLRSAWKEDLIGGPICIDDGRPIGGSLEDKAFLAAYGCMKTGAAWSLEGILQKTEEVRLEEIKLALKTIIENAKTRTILPN